MRRAAVVLAALSAALPLAAKNVTALADIHAAPRPFYTDGFLRVGYATDPLAGGEDAALRCRRAGAWTFRTSKCDEATLRFLHDYGLKAVFVPQGDLKSCVAALTRIAKGPYADAIGGVQLGDDPTGGSDPVKWRGVARAVRRSLPGVPVALPVRDEKSEIVVKMESAMECVTHLIVDLTDAPAPYARLDGISRALRAASGERIRKLKLWAVAPGGMKGLTGAREVAWQMHWIFSAFAVERTDGVFFAREYKPDDFGLVMRHFWAAAVVQPHLMGHGEGSFVEEAAAKQAKRPAVADVSTDLELSDSAGVDALDEGPAAAPAPQACARVAEGRPGDLEYLVFSQAPGVEGNDAQMCLAVVNTSGEPVELGVKITNKCGQTGSGYWRQMKPDPKTGAFANLTFMRGPKETGKFIETIAPGEISFIDFRVW